VGIRGELKSRIRTIDGFDEILVVLRKLPIRTQEIIVLKLQGMYFKDIGKKYCICEGLHGVRNETD